MPSSRFVKSRGVIDASCLIRLLYLKNSRPDLNIFGALGLRYDVVYIPVHVWEEVSRHGRGKRRFREFVQESRLFERCDVADQYRVQLLYDRLLNPSAPIQRGEAEAIIQATERGVTDILIDDRRAANFARRHSLVARDTPDLLVEFKRTGIIGEARLLVETLHENRKFRLRQQRLGEVLKEVGE